MKDTDTRPTADTRSPGALHILGVLAALVMLSIVIRLPDLGMPLERDEGEYAYAAQEILRGYMPYQDTFCQKPPVVFLWYLAGIVLFGQTIAGIHSILTIAAALGALGVYLLARRLFSGTGGWTAGGAWIAAVAFLASSAGSGYFGSAANTEIFMLVPVVFGVLSLTAAAERDSRSAWFATGFFFGIAMMTKQVALFSFVGPGIVAAALLWIRRRPVSAHVKPLIYGVIGTVTAVLPLLLWFAMRGVLATFWEVAFSHNISYVGSPYGADKWEKVWNAFTGRFLATDGLLWASLLVVLVLLVFSSRARRGLVAWLIPLWFASSLFGVALGPFTFGHYFLQLLPPLTLALGFVAALAGGAFSGQWPTARARALAVVIGLVALAPMVVARLDSVQAPLSQRSHELYGIYGPPPFQAAVEVGAWLEERSAPDDTILIVGSEPEILFYSGRRSSTRYTIFYPLTGAYESSGPMCAELFAEIERSPPEFVILVYCQTSFITGGRSDEIVKGIFHRVGELLQADYTEVDQVFVDKANGKVFWQRRDRLNPQGLVPLFHIFRRNE